MPVYINPTPTFIRAWREEHHISRKRLAELFGVSERSIRRWETGERLAPPWVGYALAGYVSDKQEREHDRRADLIQGGYGHGGR